MSPSTDFNSEDSSVSPDCRQTAALLNRVFDNEVPLSMLETDSHSVSCQICRERIATAKLVLVAHAAPPETVTANSVLTDRIVAAVLEETRTPSHVRSRRRIGALTGTLAIAAALLLAVWLQGSKVEDGSRTSDHARISSTDPIIKPESHAEPSPPAVRLGDEINKAEKALLGSSKPITEPAAIAPQVLAKLTDVLTRPSAPAAELNPARVVLFELPEAARSGLQPVTATTQKAFARLLRDVASVQIASKPN